MEGVQVSYVHDLSQYRLPVVPNGVGEAVAASLGYLEVGDYQVTVPLWAAMYLAPLAEILPPSFTVWLYGTTGSLKSTITALAMCHYGRFAYNMPPASWTGTANALEKKAFLVKDAPLWIDDYTAQATTRGMNEIRRKAEQLLRDWGNRAGRSRMRADLRLRRTFAPRGLIISTAEQLPPGQSILARLYAVEVHPGMVTGGAGSALTRAQLEEQGVYPHAMAGYLEWLANRWEGLGEVLGERHLRYTEAAREEGEHLRMPQTVATMFVGWELGLEFAQVAGALGERDVEGLREIGWRILLGIGEAQHRIVAEENPVDMYLEALTQMLAMGTVYLRHRVYCEDSAKDWPSKRTFPCEFLGWYDSNFLYLIPRAAYNAVTAFYRAGGTAFPDSERGLRVKLEEQGLLVRQGMGERSTAVLRIGGEAVRVLRVARAGKFQTLVGDGCNGCNGSNGNVEVEF